MYTLKAIAQRSTLLGSAVALVAATILPAGVAFADALNPLTKRSLMLSSSAPGFIDTDGSGNSNAAPNSIGKNYQPAGSGPNGKKTGETFTFTISSDADVEGFSFQYCTVAAGFCRAPGDNTGDADPNNDGNTADSTRELNSAAHPNGRSDLEFVSAFTQAPSATAPDDGEFQIYVGGSPITYSTAWTFAKSNLEDTEYSGHSGTLTGKSNYVTLSNTTSGEELSLTDGTEVKIVFKASESIHITNPGSGHFFVKLNTYSDGSSMIGSQNDATPLDDTDHTVIDGGVTVANVMTDSIHITTKVLETMAFSVGTRNRDTVDLGTGQTHGSCDAIEQINNNRLNLGNPDAEYSLETGKAWDVYSYWRLSSNSSGGATVYYSGNTLANTVGDEIADMPSEVVSTPGTEQFGLGFVDAGLDDLDGDGPGGTPEDADWATNYETPDSAPFITLGGAQAQSGPEYPTPQTAQTNYDEAFGTLDDGAGHAGTAKFRFLKSSLTVPEPIAQQDEEVISCATAKMRYVANIAADTPAGVYTTKVNYLAAPQY